MSVLKDADRLFHFSSFCIRVLPALENELGSVFSSSFS